MALWETLDMPSVRVMGRSVRHYPLTRWLIFHATDNPIEEKRASEPWVGLYVRIARVEPQLH